MQAAWCVSGSFLPPPPPPPRLGTCACWVLRPGSVAIYPWGLRPWRTCVWWPHTRRKMSRHTRSSNAPRGNAPASCLFPFAAVRPFRGSQVAPGGLAKPLLLRCAGPIFFRHHFTWRSAGLLMCGCGGVAGFLHGAPLFAKPSGGNHQPLRWGPWGLKKNAASWGHFPQNRGPGRPQVFPSHK